MSTSAKTQSIAMCITELDVGGAEKAFVRIAQGLQNRHNWQVRAISLRDAGAMATPLVDSGIHVSALGCGSFADVRTWSRLRANISADRPDVMLCFLHQANIYGRLVARGQGIPSVSGIRVADRRWSVILPERITKCCVQQYVAVSQSVAKTHGQICKIPTEKLLTIPNGIDVDSVGLRKEPEAATILFVGRLTQQKAPQDLIEAYQQLPEAIRDETQVVFAGEGPLRAELEEMIRADGLEDRVRLLGHSDRVDELMRGATLLVLPSRWEGMPNTVLEAMACGTPVIAAAVDGVGELVQDGTTGWLFPTGDTRQLSLQLAEALTAPNLRHERAIAAHQRVTDQFNWDCVVSSYDVLLRSLMDR